MKLAPNFAILTCVVFIADAAIAQPRPKRERQPPHPSKDHKADHDGRSVQQDRQCASRRALLTQEEKQLERHQSELAGMDAEIVQLERQQNELRKQRRQQQTLVSGLRTRVDRAQSIYKSYCADDEQCGESELAAQDIDTRGQSVEGELDGVRTEIESNRQVTRSNEARIEPLRKEYAEKRCQNLVPGETTQATIDRCSAIFSEWNRLQADLNARNRHLAGLKSRYERLLAELRGLERRSATYASYIEERCRIPGPVQVRPAVYVRNFGPARQRAEQIGGDLDQLIAEVARLRGLRITVEAH